MDNQIKVSIIIPVYNEEKNIFQCLESLKSLRQSGYEIIVVDGGSTDNSVSIAQPLCTKIIHSQKSRSIQMNAGAKIAKGQCLIFLHADTLLPDGVNELFEQFGNIETTWGRFDIRLSGSTYFFRIIESCMNLRSRVTGIATGDQVLFVGKKLFDRVNGFPSIALMEDVEICKILLRYSKPVCLQQKVLSSSRRWEEHGVINTILKMWMLRLLNFFRYHPDKLAKLYS